MPAETALRWGRITNPNIRNPFAAARIDALSFATTPLLIFSGEKQLGYASGFYWRSGTGSFLITNWHVVTGNDPFTRKALKPNDPPPTKIVAYDTEWLKADNNPNFDCPIRTKREISLFSADDSPVWLQHSHFDTYRTDVVAIPLEGWAVARKQEHLVCVNEYGFAPLPHFVGSDLFIAGYPLANFDGWMLPIWKRGSFAAEPLIPFDDRPMFIIDVASSRGMSGSPVFRRIFGPSPSPNLSSVDPSTIVTTEFAGVYAGRLESAELERVGLGYAWYGNVINEILAERRPGSTA